MSDAASHLRAPVRTIEMVKAQVEVIVLVVMGVLVDGNPRKRRGPRRSPVREEGGGTPRPLRQALAAVLAPLAYRHRAWIRSRSMKKLKHMAEAVAEKNEKDEKPCVKESDKITFRKLLFPQPESYELEVASP